MAVETARRNERLQVRDGISLSLKGPEGNLQVTLETLHGDQLLNELAPQGTVFTAETYRLTETLIDRKLIIVSLAKRERDILPYAILHGIARLRLHDDPLWHATSREAHDLLASQLSNLQAYGKVPKPETLEEVHAWEIVSQDERRTSEMALGSIKDLREQGIDPLPYARNICDLTKIVNHRAILRTARQIQIFPPWTEKQIGMPLTLPEYWVAAGIKTENP